MIESTTSYARVLQEAELGLCVFKIPEIYLKIMTTLIYVDKVLKSDHT